MSQFGSPLTLGVAITYAIKFLKNNSTPLYYNIFQNIYDNFKNIQFGQDLPPKPIFNYSKHLEVFNFQGGPTHLGNLGVLLFHFRNTSLHQINVFKILPCIGLISMYFSYFALGLTISLILRF
jgi:hypothetical protein